MELILIHWQRLCLRNDVGHHIMQIQLERNVKYHFIVASKLEKMRWLDSLDESWKSSCSLQLIQ